MNPDSILSIRHLGQSLIEALHDAVEARDHNAARECMRMACRAGYDAATPPDIGVGYPRLVRDQIGTMNE